MSDPTPEQPVKRMTTAEAAKTAQDALALAGSVIEDVERLGEKLTELDQRSRDGGSANTDTSEALAHRLDQLDKLVTTRYADKDAVDGRIHEALEPLHAEVHELRGHLGGVKSGAPTFSQVDEKVAAQVANLLARLEDAERKLATVDANGIVATVAQQLHPAMSDLRTRLGEVENRPTREPEIASLSSLELDTRVNAAVEQALTDLSTTSDVSVARVDQLVREFEAVRLEVASLQGLLSATPDRADNYLRNLVQGHVDRVVQALMAADDNARERMNWLTDQVTDLRLVAGPPIAGQTAPAGAFNGTGAARKVLQLMRAVTHIGKDQEANLGQGGRFKFRGVDDAMDAVGYAMRDVGLILGTDILKDESTHTPITKRGTNKDGAWENTVVWTSTKLTVRYTFVDPEDGSSHSLEMTGEGRDASDKSTSKAASMALKYGLFQALMIPVNGLDDSDASPPQVMQNERSRPAQQQERPQQQTEQPPAPPAEPEDQRKARRAGEALGAIRNVHRVPGGPLAQAERLKSIMQQVNAEGLTAFELDGAMLVQHADAVMRTLQAPPPGDAPDDSGSHQYGEGGY